MKPKYSFSAVLLIVILVLLFQFNKTSGGHSGTSLSTAAPAYHQDAHEELVEVKVESRSPTSTTAKAVDSQTQLPQDGSELLQDHCAKCHTVLLLEQSKKSRTDWEKTLSRMETQGVRLTDIEKKVLLEYLSAR